MSSAGPEGRPARMGVAGQRKRHAKSVDRGRTGAMLRARAVTPGLGLRSGAFRPFQGPQPARTAQDDRRSGAGLAPLRTRCESGVALATSTWIHARNASFGYGTTPVLTGVDLAVGAGDFLGVLGPNGGGKTTLFRGLLGLISPLVGTVDRGELHMGYVPQREVLDEVYPLTVEGVVHMGAYGRLSGLRSLSRAEREWSAACLERVGLASRARAPFASLSGGQRQRVLIARALVMRPEVLFLDEPTSGVDARAQEQIFALLAELHAEGGLAILIVTHGVQRIRSVVREALWVADGCVRRGRIDDVLRHGGALRWS